VTATIHHGDCLEILRAMPDASVDSVVTDPPYGLSFMGKKWDYDVPSEDIWRECLRVLKPGGHLLAFAGTRTQHRMAVRIEDVGFEVRDLIAWVYGSGFPKSLDVSKAIDKAAGRNSDAVAALKDELRKVFDSSGLTLSILNERCGFEASGYLRKSSTWTGVLPSPEKWWKMREVIGCDESLSFEFKEIEREVIGQKPWTNSAAHFVPGENHKERVNLDITAPATEAARQWQGWGTALKPALEPITVARKPLQSTVAANVLEHGTGAINIDGCRVPTDDKLGGGMVSMGRPKASEGWDRPWMHDPEVTERKKIEAASKVAAAEALGRWPANVIHDGSEEVVGLFPETGKSTGGRIGNAGGGSVPNVPTGTFEAGNPGYGDTGSAARFFYCAKASKADRDADNHHPTVKPTDLMRYLCRLVTPPGGIVLDPFMGSGSTGKAAILEGFQFIGIEREAEYVAIAKARIVKAEARRGEMLPFQEVAAGDPPTGRHNIVHRMKQAGATPSHP
jgi:DNA modification methylase